MPRILVRHKVKDFAQWKQLFDEHAGARKTHGSKGGLVFRNADDPSEVVVLLEWKDLAAARKFTQSDDLRQRMEQAGVVDQADIYFIEEVDKPAF